MLTVKITDSPFCAKGDGISNDRESIQKALDFVHEAGGGTVVIPSGYIFMSTGIVIRSNVTLFFEDGAELHQITGLDGYVKPTENGYEPYTPILGHNWSDSIKWSHTWYKNYPFIFAPQGSHDFAVKGNGIIRMSEYTDDKTFVRICPIGFYRVGSFEISDITINNYHGYAMMPFTCHDGLISNVKIYEWNHGNGDGICLMNCRNMRITGCSMYTGDDSVYIFSSYKDPRASEWWSSDEPQPSENIEIDHNDLKSNNCKAFGMILWGVECDDLEKIEVRNVYVHDNHFVTMGNWLFNPYTTKPNNHPVTTVRFENNVIDGIEENFFETQISDMNHYHSMRSLDNGDFRDGKVYWVLDKNVQVIRDGENRAEITGEGSIYQGLWLDENKPYTAYITSSAKNNGLRFFVRELDTGKTVFEHFIESTGDKNREKAEFSLDRCGNYHIGVESLDKNGTTAVYSVELAGTNEASFGHKSVTKDGGKVIYRF